MSKRILANFIQKVRTCAHHGVRNVSFSENFAYVPNEWSLKPLRAIIFK